MAPNFSQTLSFGSDHRGVQNAKLAATSLAIYLTDKDQIQQVPFAPFQIPEQDVLGGVHPTERYGADAFFIMPSSTSSSSPLSVR